LRGSLILGALVLLLWGVYASSLPLKILYTNDLHSRLDRLESLAELIEKERLTEGPVLLFDVGDTWQDFRVPIYAVWGANEVVSWMNRVSYDAMGLGNHDLYWGADQLAELCAGASFPILCANLRPRSGIAPPFVPYTFISISGVEILVIGLITSEYLPYPDFPWLRYVAPERALEDVLEEAGETADLVIVLGHLPVVEACRIAQVVPGVDIFLTGHSHETTEEPVIVGQTLVLQAGAFGRYLGRLQLELDPGTGAILQATNDLLSTEKTPAALGRGYLKLFEVLGLIAFLLFLLR